jgi:hypothetical protein
MSRRDLSVDDLKLKWWKYERVYRTTNDLGLPVLRLPKNTLLFRAVPASISDSNSGAAAKSHVGWAASFQSAAGYAFGNDFENMLGENGKVIVLRLTRDVDLLNLKRCDDAAKIRDFLKTALEQKMQQKLQTPAKTKSDTSVAKKRAQQRIRRTLAAFDYAFRCKHKVYKASGTRRAVLKRYSTFEDDAILAKSLCKLGMQGWANEPYARGKFHDEVCLCYPKETWQRTGYEIRRVCGHPTLLLTHKGRVVNERIRPSGDAGLDSKDFQEDSWCASEQERYTPGAAKQSDAFLRTREWKEIRHADDGFSL